MLAWRRSNSPEGYQPLRDTSLAWLLAGTVCLGGLALTSGLGAALNNFYRHQLAQRFEAIAKQRATAMQADFSGHMQVLDGIRRFFVNADQVSRSEFAGYVGGLPNRAFSYAWLPRVSAEQRPAFEREVQAYGGVGVQIRELLRPGVLQVAAPRAEYFPVLYIESPSLPAEKVLGLNLGALPGRRETLQRARDSGQLAVSGVIRFLATAGTDDGLIMVAPVYRGARPGTGPDRHAELRGYVMSAFSLQQLLHEHEYHEDALNLSLELRDISPLDGEKLHYRSAVEATDSRLHLERTLQLADRRYMLSIRPSEAFLRANTTPGLVILLGSGSLLSLLLAALLFSLVSQRQRAQALVRERTAALRQRESELARANSQLRSVLNSATQVAVITTDLQGVIRTFNIGAERMLGYRAEQLIGQATPERIHLAAEVQERSRELSAQLGRPISGFGVFVAEAAGQQGHVEREWTYVRQDGSQLVVNLIVTAVRDEQDELVGYLGIAIDITEAKQSRQELEARDQLLRKLTANVPGALYQYQLMSDGRSRFPYASAGISAIYELEPDALREDASLVFERIHPEDLEQLKRSISLSVEHLQPWRQDYRVLLPKQGLRWLRGEASPERLADGSTLWHGYLSDVTGPKLVEQELRTLSITDVLTGTYNRRYFQERLDVEIARARRHPEIGLAVVMLDIDHFKQVNDRFGHDVGDRVLKDVCQRIRQRLRTIDVLCRLGGEEFIVLAPGTDVQQGAILAQALCQVLSSEEVEDVGLVTASFGVSAWRHGEGAAAMLSRVDAAVYQAKQDGRNRVQVAP